MQTICVGIAMSMGALLLAGGEKGKRLATPNSKILIHQVSSTGIGGQATDIEIHAREIIETDAARRDHRQPHGPGHREGAKDTDRDYFMKAEEAVEYGIIDRVIENR